jgi:hypothetical protein
MHESKDSDQEPSAEQNHEHLTCPNCGDTVQAITRRGPTDATANPCGCSLSSLHVQELAPEEVGA